LCGAAAGIAGKRTLPSLLFSLPNKGGRNKGKSNPVLVVRLSQSRWLLLVLFHDVLI
jgi:hypothetical protein